MPFWTKEKDLAELEEENERVSQELSLAQKQAAIKRLKQAGLTGKQFNWNWQSIMSWIKTH